MHDPRKQRKTENKTERLCPLQHSVVPGVLELAGKTEAKTDRLWGNLAVSYKLKLHIHSQYSAIADIHTFQFTAAQALGFSLSTSRLLATDFDTELPQSHTPSIIHKSSLHNPSGELAENYSRTTPKRALDSPVNP
jgi:hypothetical protein